MWGLSPTPHTLTHTHFSSAPRQANTVIHIICLCHFLSQRVTIRVAAAHNMSANFYLTGFCCLHLANTHSARCLGLESSLLELLLKFDSNCVRQFLWWSKTEVPQGCNWQKQTNLLPHQKARDALTHTHTHTPFALRDSWLFSLMTAQPSVSVMTEAMCLIRTASAVVMAVLLHTVLLMHRDSARTHQLNIVWGFFLVGFLAVCLKKGRHWD